MAIVALDKLTVYGTSGQKADVLEGLQQLGCMHLVNLRGTAPQQPELVSREARAALRYLQACPDQRQQMVSSMTFDRETIIREVLAAKEQREQLAVERDQLYQAISDLEPWGDFSWPASAPAGEPQFWFYEVPLNRISELPEDVVWHLANSDNRYAYVVVIASELPVDFPFTPIELENRPLSQLRLRLEAVQEELEQLSWKRITLTRWRRLLKNDLDAADDKAAQAAAAEGVLDDRSVFSLQGWVPHQATADVRNFADRHQLAVTIEPVAAAERPPTLLKNPERIAGAEGCVTFYITPGYHAWDPTTVVYFSFSLFFAMIVADAGYGLIMAGLLLFSWRKLSHNRSGRRMRNLLLGIVSTTIIYGMIVGSYCGVEPPSGMWLDSLRVKIDGQPMMSNQTAMMVIAVAIGVTHLILANVISAWRHRASLRCLGHLGWAGIMLGGFLAGTGTMSKIQPLTNAGTTLVIIGGVAVLLFSSERPVATWSITVQLRRLLDGVMQFSNLSKAFGDSLSYLRLFALGLASAQLAVTFNGLAAGAYDAGGIGVLLALLILAVGHGINFLLGLMGGVVHGLRLNCIEFFNWSLTEEGHPFQPFRKKAET